MVTAKVNNPEQPVSAAPARETGVYHATLQLCYTGASFKPQQ